MLQAKGLYNFYTAELPQVHGTSILGMNLSYLYAGPETWTWVTRVQGKAANHYSNGTS